MSRLIRIRRRLTLGLLLAACSVAEHTSAAPTSRDAGEAIYRRGALPDGRPLQAQRENGATVSGADAACINCHRRSGLGAVEGRNTIPPITGRYLFHPRAATLQDIDLPFVKGVQPDRDPYTDSTLARAIREGVAADGRRLSYLMPQYAMDDAAMADLIAYLKDMSVTSTPGVTESVLHFATIVTPDADPIKREGMLSVLRGYFQEKNRNTRARSARLHSSQRMEFRVDRAWQLHVWELSGSPEGWDAQLRRYLQAEPVFAVISGVGGKTWAPVHRFCERESLPCLFPNVELPIDAERDFYSVYFSKGVLLEAQLIADQLGKSSESSSVRRVVQIARAGDVGEDAGQILSKILKERRLDVETRLLKRAGAGAELGKALRGVGKDDALVLWLRPADVAMLEKNPPEADVAFVSGEMSGLETAPLPPAWRRIARMAYPVDLPDKRRVRLDYPFGWFRLRQIPVVAERVQADTYLAAGLLAETLSHMVDTFERDYLIERVESMLERRIITGYYPRLSLAPGQRFASKGGYVVQFKEPSGKQLIAVSDWTIP